MDQDTLAGYSIVRALGSGGRSQVYLGQRESLEGEAVSAGSAKNLVALKHCYRTGALGMESEAEALSRAAGEHVVAILDIATLVDQRRCLVLDWLPQGSLARLIDRRRTIDPGEAVTILAPLAMALDVLHRSGVIHGKIRASAVLFSANGAPTFASFGDARLITPDLSAAELAASQGVQDDCHAFSALARTVLECVASSNAEAVIELLVDSEAAERHDNFGTELAQRLFHWSQPSPIVFGVRSSPPLGHGVRASSTRPLSGGEFAPIVDRAAAPDVEPSGQQVRPPWLHSINLPDWIESAVTSTVASTVASLRRNAQVIRWGRELTVHADALRTHLRGVRRRTWLLAAVAMLSLVGVTAVLGMGDAESGQQPSAGDTSSSLAPDDTSAATIYDEASAAVSGDDPLAALPELLRARQLCLSELSVLCLDSVAQQGSTAMLEDVAAIGALSEGTTPRPNPVATSIPASSELVLIERLGDTALVGIPESLRGESTTASILMMRGEAGWLVRSFVPGS